VYNVITITGGYCTTAYGREIRIYSKSNVVVVVVVMVMVVVVVVVVVIMENIYVV